MTATADERADDSIMVPTSSNGGKTMATLTDAQQQAVRRLYRRNPDGSDTLAIFAKRVHQDPILDCIMIYWCRMWIGIETDGHTHS